MDNIFFQILWVVSALATIVAAVLAGRGARWRQLGRVATAVLFVIGGALLHVINLATGGDYTSFADPAHFDWVTDTWRDVVGPNQVLFIGLLIVFEATVGFLAIAGGRWTQAGYAGVIAFYLALWLFGPIETVFVAVMLVPMWLLLRAERKAAVRPISPLDREARRPAHAAS